MNVHLLGEDWLLDLAREKSLLDAVEFICGHDITLIQTHLFCKPFGCPETPWHQDGREQNTPMATVWISLDDLSHPTSGALCVLPQLHSYGLLPSESSNHFQFDNVLTQDFVQQFESVIYDLKPGQAAIHHPLLPHASMANTILPYRRVIVLRYLSTTALEGQIVPLYRAKDNGELELKAGEENEEKEYYQDYRDSNVHFEGRCIVLRGKYVDDT
ncbi:hypothetical protein THRCLA_22378 [Thraustotheca clavata]|uniref:Phytanoyl-CoA dioxygenase n=1 Tax=Thraustotheca clavata TaxID=74557 RepID=A0A1V9Z3Z8_9STRA|nr:hypothetical protein THRCLA_22378 [Thraustotheca clavata]